MPLPIDATDVGLFPTGVSVFHIMRQVPNFVEYTGGAISADPAVNQAGMAGLLNEMKLRGRGECKLPAGEMPLVSGFQLPGSNTRICGGGRNQTILVFGPGAGDCIIDKRTGNALEGLGILSQGSAGSIAVYQASTALEFTRDAGGIVADDLHLNNFSQRGLGPMMDCKEPRSATVRSMPAPITFATDRQIGM